MTAPWIFASGFAVTLIISLLVVFYLQKPLQELLEELCGHPRRADFWTAFSVVSVSLMPVIFALGSRPAADGSIPALLGIADQVRWGLIGLVVSVIVLGWVVGSFVRRAAPKA